MEKKERLHQCYSACKQRGDTTRTKYIRNFYFNQAAAICHYVQQEFPDEQSSCATSLAELTKHFFGKTVISTVVSEVKQTLTELRNQSTQLSPPDPLATDGNPLITDFFKNMSDRIRQDVVVKLFNFCRKVIDEQRQGGLQPDWKYAVIAFGSLARSEATPYSDFEWGILVQDGDGDVVSSDCLNYFRELTTLVHFLVISLGETILPAMAINELDTDAFFDETTTRGFAFDGLMAQACKWPLGNLHLHNWDHSRSESFELIGHPKDLAGFQSEESYNRSPEFAFSLLNAAFICGEESLFTEYEEECAKAAPNEEMRNHVRHILMEDCARYRYKAFAMMSTGTILNPKKDLYRLFDRSVLALWYYDLLTGSHEEETTKKSRVVSLSSVEMLPDVSCLGEEGKRNIRVAILVAMWLRLQTYCSQRGRDTLTPRTEDQSKLIKRYYYTAIPFGELLFQALESSTTPLVLTSQEFFANNSVVEGMVLFRLGHYVDCKKHFEDGLVTVQDSKYVCTLFLAHVHHFLGCYEEAVKCFDEVLKEEANSDNVVSLKISMLHSLHYLMHYERLNNLLSELENSAFNPGTSPNSAAHIGLALLQYYQTVHLLEKEQSLRLKFSETNIPLVNERDAVDWSNKEEGISWYRKQLNRLRRLYGGYSHHYLPTIAKFMAFCHRHHCLDAVQDEIMAMDPKGMTEEAMLWQFRHFQAMEQVNWAEAKQCLIEWEKLLTNSNNHGENNASCLRLTLYVNRLQVHLCDQSYESDECRQCLRQSIQLWNALTEKEKIGSDWGDLALNIGDVLVKLKKLEEGRQFLKNAKVHYHRCGDPLNVAWAECALIGSYLHDNLRPDNLAERFDVMIDVFQKHRAHGREAASYRFKASLLQSELEVAEVLELLTAAYDLAKSMGVRDIALEGDILVDLIQVKTTNDMNALEERNELTTLHESFPGQFTRHVGFVLAMMMANLIKKNRWRTHYPTPPPADSARSL